MNINSLPLIVDLVLVDTVAPLIRHLVLFRTKLNLVLIRANFWLGPVDTFTLVVDVLSFLITGLDLVLIVTLVGLGFVDTLAFVVDVLSFFLTSLDLVFVVTFVGLRSVDTFTFVVDIFSFFVTTFDLVLVVALVVLWLVDTITVVIYTSAPPTIEASWNLLQYFPLCLQRSFFTREHFLPHFQSIPQSKSMVRSSRESLRSTKASPALGTVKADAKGMASKPRKA